MMEADRAIRNGPIGGGQRFVLGCGSEAGFPCVASLFPLVRQQQRGSPSARHLAVPVLAARRIRDSIALLPVSGRRDRGDEVHPDWGQAKTGGLSSTSSTITPGDAS
jgi:hypothetical protein